MPPSRGQMYVRTKGLLDERGVFTADTPGLKKLVDFFCGKMPGSRVMHLEMFAAFDRDDGIVAQYAIGAIGHKGCSFLVFGYVTKKDVRVKSSFVTVVIGVL